MDEVGELSRIDYGALESEARFIAQLAATIAAGEVASSPPDKIFEAEDRQRFVKLARSFLRESRRQVNEGAGLVPVYDFDHMPEHP